MKKQGFTLIELLVVIAIIGILSSVVLASLNTARQKGKDAAAMAELGSLRIEAELQSDGDGYDDVCTAGTRTKAIFDSAVGKSDGGTEGEYCNDDVDGWAAYVTLSGGVIYCVDDSGYTGNPAVAPTGISCE